MAIHSSILAWKISCTEEPGRLQSVGRKEWDTTERAQLQQRAQLILQGYLKLGWPFRKFMNGEDEARSLCLHTDQSLDVVLPGGSSVPLGKAAPFNPQQFLEGDSAMTLSSLYSQHLGACECLNHKSGIWAVHYIIHFTQERNGISMMEHNSALKKNKIHLCQLLWRDCCKVSR